MNGFLYIKACSRNCHSLEFRSCWGGVGRALSQWRLLQTWETLLSGIITDQMGSTFRQNASKIPLPDKLRNPQVEKSWKTGGWTSPCGVRPTSVDMETSLIRSLVTELNSLFNLGLGCETIHDRLFVDDSLPRRYLCVAGSHAINEGNNLADRGHEVVICAVPGWRPNKTAVEEMAAKVEEALKLLTPNDVVILHLFDNVAYMARSEEGGDLSIRQYCTGEFHVEGDLVLAGKDRLYMYFRNALPLLRLLEALMVVFLTPLLRYLQEGCCNADDHAPTRFDEGFEASLQKGLMETRGFFKDFLFTNNLRFKIINPGLCVPLSDASGNPPVHPLYGGYRPVRGARRKRRRPRSPDRAGWSLSTSLWLCTAADHSRVGAGTASASRCEAGRPVGSAAMAGESEAGGVAVTSCRPIRQQFQAEYNYLLDFLFAIFFLHSTV
jgi:hypothetical protein